MDVQVQDKASIERPQILVAGTEPLAADATATWALERLSEVLASRGLQFITSGHGAMGIVVGLAGGPADAYLAAVDATVPAHPEAFTIARTSLNGTDTLVVVGADSRGLSYGLLELADVAELDDDPLAALQAVQPTSQRPATPLRGVLRTLTSDVQDLPWLHDRVLWDEYLTELATHRINRLHLALGMQYNYSHDIDVQDNYLTLAYPFLVDVPGYDVRAGGVDDAERACNLDSLRFISSEAKRRGIHFQLGLWNHAYHFPDSDRIRYPITGLTPENHAEYCAAGLEQLLVSCPDIGGVTVRVHYEGGVHEPTHAFWGTVLSAIPRVGRPIELDMHSKGVDSRLVDAARSTGSQFNISAKYWAEHWGLPYHQASVRAEENPRPPREGLSTVTQNERRFTRYGYGDFLREDRDYDFVFRIWPGSQRVLLWGDPDLAAGIGRLGTIGGARGVELCEPLTFKGRKTTGTEGGRDPYIDESLRLERDPWKKYRYTYRLWGRLLYNPDADPSSWRRHLRHEFGAASEHVEAALGAASRILPLVTTTHGPSASCNFYWTEMYVNMPLAESAPTEHYTFDTPEPWTPGAVSPFDPQLFESIDTELDGVLAGRRSGRYTQTEVAEWLDRLAGESERELAAAVAESPDAAAPQFRRMQVDVAALAGLGRFFAEKTRAGLAYGLYDRTKDATHLTKAVAYYRAARDAYASVVDVTSGVYQPDITFGDRVAERGHWSDRLPAIEEDLSALEAQEARVRAEGTSAESAALPPAVERGEQRAALVYELPSDFVPGEDLPLEVAVRGDEGVRVELYYRHLNQGQRWVTVTMDGEGERRTVSVPGDYTDSPYPLELYFIVTVSSGDAWIVPGLDQSLANQPYHVLRQRGARAPGTFSQAAARS